MDPLVPVGGATDPVTRALQDILRRVSADHSGAIADYIPELARADPEAVAISAASVLGGRYHAGAAEASFTIQSISKPFVYAVALEELGLEAVHRHVGYEPSGEPFNASSLDQLGRPVNPMINAGAIVTSALIAGDNREARYERIRRALSDFAGRTLDLDARAYASESATGHRNRSLAELALSTGALARDVDDATDVYFRQCSLLVTASDLAVMGATLANAGINPLTGVRLVSAPVARHTLSLMASCGMYDHAGAWAVRVGMPAKSGVSGGIVAVKPGHFGIGVFSPRLDPAGNSSRGTEALTLLSQDYGLHMLAHPQAPTSPIHETRTTGDGELTLVLRGEIDLLAIEYIVHELRSAHPIAALTLDLSFVTAVQPPAARLLSAAEAGATGWGPNVVLINQPRLFPRNQEVP